MICTLLNLDVPAAPKRARLWIKPGQICHLGRGTYLTFERVRDAWSGDVDHRIDVLGPDILIRGMPATAVLNLSDCAGMRVVPRALERDRLLVDFSQSGCEVER